MNGVDASCAFDRVVVLRTEGFERSATESRTHASLNGVAGQQTGEPVHLSLHFMADHRDLSMATAWSPVMAEVVSAGGQWW